jgi:DNA-binding transcriptional ArsR family regulator
MRLLHSPRSWSDRGVTGTQSVLRAWRAFDGTALDEAGTIAQRELAESGAHDHDSLATLQLALASAWYDLARRRTPTGDDAAAIEQRARRLGAPELVLEAAALRTMAAMDAGDLELALEHARRSFRMARTETLPDAEHLAAVILARIRRYTGQPYLATRIATALRRFAAPDWRPWIDWEITLASGAAPDDACGPATLLARAIACARAGDRGGFATVFAELEQRARSFATLAADVARVRIAIDPTLDLAASEPAMVAWCEGRDPFAAPPFGLVGLDRRLDDEEDIGLSLVIASPARAGRRTLLLARRLAEQDGACVLEGRAGRAEGIIAALALTDAAGVAEPELFASVYGFAYVAALHRGAFDVALHRARARLESLGTIERSDGRIRLVVHAPFVVPDPRALPATSERVLGRLARVGDIGAKELAAALGMPLRTVQDSLRVLVEDGACTTKRDGRRVVYSIEDTTFQEPTNV